MRISKSVIAGIATTAVAASGLAGSALTTQTSAAGTSAGVKMNQIQVMGSHNSYHRELSDNEKKIQVGQNPGAVDLFYSHAPIGQQLEDQNVRQLELDLVPDPNGGLYTYPLIRKIAGLPALTDPELAKPGIKVMHIVDVDYNTVCRSFKQCLQQVKTWSDAHPYAAPVVISLELKQSDPAIVAQGGVKAPPWDAGNLNSVDAEIRSVFSENQLLSPDDVRKSGLTLEQSVTTKGWPTLKNAAGKVLFYFDNAGPGTELRNIYREGKPNLEGRAVFTRGAEGEADAAITQVNDPRGAGTAEIQRLVKKGYLVRTRSDEPLSTIRNNEFSRVGIALASGAQFVSTDFPVAGMASRYDSDFVAELPGDTPVRLNPVTGKPGLRVAER
ncbi:phosphatidylinositol-specific phospholipase C1-like protein [Kribbella sp. NPDC056345]|uniref:phosphatidylinositol-specific phospholipase C1-like protein n=1 Tax=Kribbella sp. NPDC056345 TaxID=3345789 RepID=UPI0035DA1655